MWLVNPRCFPFISLRYVILEPPSSLFILCIMTTFQHMRLDCMVVIISTGGDLRKLKNLMKKTVQIYTVFAASLSSSFGSILNSTSASAAKLHKSDTMKISHPAFVII